MADKDTTDTAAPAAPDAPIPALPTTAEADAMFAERPDLYAVVTDKGRMTRDGVLTPSLTGE
jgi:hypothetical protein